MRRASGSLDRRRMLAGVGSLGLTGLAGCATPGGVALAPYDRPPRLAPLRAHADRLFDITVCLRPFRAAGPRLDTERVGDTLVVHNYGHGGSGWSLSWGSGTIAVGKAMAGGPQFAVLWETMARTSFKTYRQYLGLPGSPVEWVDRYTVLDEDPAPDRGEPAADGFGHYGDRIADLTPGHQVMPRGATPFDAHYVSRTSILMFNVADYGHTLMSDFFAAGGTFQRAEFHEPAELAALKEKVVINCPGYGGRDLWRDESLVPVRGQIGWLIPQPELTYGLYYRDVAMLPRRDGIVVQAVEGGDLKGYGDANEAPDRAESEKAVATLADLYSRWRA